MEITTPTHEKHLLVCVHDRPANAGVSCGPNGGAEIAEILKQAVKDAGLSQTIRVSRSQCLALCKKGPNVLLFPDNICFNHVDKASIPAILEKIGIRT
jgi:NADP-reducing hydrogenase subunit HndC